MSTYYKATRLDGLSFMTPSVDYGAALVSGEVIRHPSSKKIRNEPYTYLSVSVAAADCTGALWPCRLFRVEPVGRVMANLEASPNKRAVSALRVVEELPAHLTLGPNGEQVAAFIEACQTLTKEDWGKAATAGGAARDAARAAARAAAWAAARDAARDAARAAARDAAWDAAWDAARAAARAAAWAAARDAARAAARDAARAAARAAAWAAARDAARDAARAAARDAAWDAAWDAARALVTRDLITPAQYDILTQPFVDAGFAGMVGR